MRIAFDGDAVLFSDEAERVYQSLGLQAFSSTKAPKPASRCPTAPSSLPWPRCTACSRPPAASAAVVGIRGALVVTARSALAHERAIQTLLNWNIAVDEAMFLGGLEKGPFLREFQPDFFFDDQTGHCHQRPAQHVPAGTSAQA